jgi:putative Holliday junction resolvase
MRLLGIDFGERRIGLAISDELGAMALPLDQIDAQPLAQACRRIAELARARGVGRIVVGLPRNMDGSYGPAAQTAREFSGELRKAVAADVIEWDERLTTAQAERAMVEAGYSRQRRRARRDALAAQLILQNYMDAVGGAPQ